LKLLLHACCAPCSIGCVEALGEEDVRPTLFFYNPNIHPYTEFRARREALFAFAREEGVDALESGGYGLREFLKAVDPDDRCGTCYHMRMRAAARRAKADGFDAFSTTLLISPYQDHARLIDACERCAEAEGVAFLYRDFRPRFRAGQASARARGLYMQKYCGSIFSVEERYLKG
jgi:predicted adenine nucleotide alpha hydrolase (AANH) superfamily ATPase